MTPRRPPLSPRRRTAMALALASGLLTSLALARPAGAAPGEVVFIAATNHTEPLARFEGSRLTGGFIKDLGDALAMRLQLRPRYIAQPSKRAPQALRAGLGDLLCYSRPVWIGNDFGFTLPVVQNAEVVAARPGAPAVRHLSDLRGQRLGTVLGYQHPEVDEALGAEFVRENAIDMTANLRKLAAGRMDYALTDRLVLRDLQRRQPQLGLQEVLEINTFSAVCALSPHSKLSLTAINAAIRAMQAEGELQRMIERYAPPR